MYVSASSLDQVLIWPTSNSSPIPIIPGALKNPYGLFVTSNSTVYVSSQDSFNSEIVKWTPNSSNIESVVNISGVCYDIFIDESNNNLYCSLSAEHQVIKISLNDSGLPPIVVAGNGTPALTRFTLNRPCGLFVDRLSRLYVTDCRNNRVQLFGLGQSAGVTRADNVSWAPISFNCPTDVVLDTAGYLFIVDRNNHRIVASSPNGFRCIIGCSGSRGSAWNQLNFPSSLSFDRVGNLYVVDRNNSRVQRFRLTNNVCGGSRSLSLIVAFSPRFNLGVSYNQPKLSPCATWQPEAVTAIDNHTLATNPFSIFVNSDDTLYVVLPRVNRLQVWVGANSTSMRNISAGVFSPFSVFVTIGGDIYLDTNTSNGHVDRWVANATVGEPVMYSNGLCNGLFLDIYENIYCALLNAHVVLKRSSYDEANITTVIAGNGINGSAPDMLCDPRGIFVDSKLNLYVADGGNHRIQFFRYGERNGTTVAGDGAPGTITLNNPSAVVLDADENLFIVDRDNDRIVGSSINGFRCVAGCSNTSGSASTQLNSPRRLQFDSYGNLFVSDSLNSRIQKFLLSYNACGKCHVSIRSSLRWFSSLPFQ